MPVRPDDLVSRQQVDDAVIRIFVATDERGHLANELGSSLDAVDHEFSRSINFTALRGNPFEIMSYCRTSTRQSRHSLGETDDTMNALKIVAVALVAAGVLALLYGGFSYTKETHDVKLGPIEFSVKEKQTVNVPVWAGVGAIAVGCLLLVFGSRKG